VGANKKLAPRIKLGYKLFHRPIMALDRSLKMADQLSKRQVLLWFRDRGVCIQPIWLQKWLWQDGTLYFVVQSYGQASGISDTDPDVVDVTCTHRVNGAPKERFEI
jgi:hypothetical protein